MNKKSFVTLLGVLLSNAECGVEKLYYKENNGNERVIVEYENNYMREVNVTGDSLLALANDIIRECLKH